MKVDIAFDLRDDLASRLPKDEDALRELLARAVEHELDGVTPEWLSRAGKIGGAAKTPAKKAASAENGRKWGGRPKGSKNKPKAL